MRATLGAAACAALLLGPGTASAQSKLGRCPHQNFDIVPALDVLPGVLGTLAVRTTDPDSGEPILRTTVDAADGTTIVVEQKSCEIRNLRVTLLGPDAKPGDAAIRRMAAALVAVPGWKHAYGPLDMAQALTAELASPEFERGLAAGKPFDYPAARLQPPGEGGEALVSFMSTDAYAAQFRSVLTLTLSIGGE